MARARKANSPILRLDCDVTSSGAVQLTDVSNQEARTSIAQETTESARITINTPSDSFVALPGRRTRSPQTGAFHDRVRLALKEENAGPFLNLTLIDALRSDSQRTQMPQSYLEKLAEDLAQFLGLDGNARRRHSFTELLNMMKDEMTRHETLIRRYQALNLSRRSGPSPNHDSQYNRDFGPPTDKLATFPEANDLITCENDAPASPSRSKKCRRLRRAKITHSCWRRDELFTLSGVAHPASYSEATSPSLHTVSEMLYAELTALERLVYRMNGAYSSANIVWRASPADGYSISSMRAETPLRSSNFGCPATTRTIS